MTNRNHSGRTSLSTVAGGMPHTAGAASEVLFLDPGVPDIATILGNLRPGVEAIVLDKTLPVARQMAAALGRRRDLDAIHVIAHGAAGRVSFAAGEWSALTLEENSEEFAAIGRALRSGGDLRLWSCNAAAGADGRAFIDALGQATGAEVAASTGRIGGAAFGGGWKLTTLAERAPARPPLTEVGVATYAGVLANSDYYVTVPPTRCSSAGVYFIVDVGPSGTGTTVVGAVIIPATSDGGSETAVVNIPTTDTGDLVPRFVDLC